jgi:DNA-binding transcriptional MerR regulator
LTFESGRTDAGYRIYDERTLGRLAFIARAKQLGCSLQEISDLVRIWGRTGCEPVQRRFHELVTGKIHDAGRQLTELTAFTGQLQSAAAQLSGPAVDGPCGEGCACLGAVGDRAVGAAPAGAVPGASPVGASPVGAVLVGAAPAGASPVEAIPAGASIACTLDGAAIPARVADWQALLGSARERRGMDGGGWRVELGPHADLGELSRLVRAEQACCAFFAFAITVDARGIGLEVRAPPGGEQAAAALFGPPGKGSPAGEPLS